MSRRVVTGMLLLSKSPITHRCDVRVRPGLAQLSVELHRDDLKGSVHLVLHPSAARELMKALQSAADETDRRLYRRDRDQSLEQVVEQLAAEGA